MAFTPARFPRRKRHGAVLGTFPAFSSLKTRTNITFAPPFWLIPLRKATNSDSGKSFRLLEENTIIVRSKATKQSQWRRFFKGAHEVCSNRKKQQKRGWQ